MDDISHRRRPLRRLLLPLSDRRTDDSRRGDVRGAPNGFTDIDDWRRNNINLLVSEMYDRIHSIKPWVKFGISPFGIWRNQATDPLGSATGGTQSYQAIYADTRTWVKNGWVDYINPQIYWQIGLPIADYAVLVRDPIDRPAMADARRTVDGVALLWTKGAGSPTSYAIYRFTGRYVGDLDDATNLIATRRATHGLERFIDTTALDRLWNESEPSRPSGVR